MYCSRKIRVQSAVSALKTGYSVAARPLFETCRIEVVRESHSNHAASLDLSNQRSAKDNVLDQRLLPQGLIPDEDVSPDNRFHVVAEAFPPVIQQARNNMLKHKDCVVITRVGNFYELYFEQAEEYGQLLGLKVASKKTSAGAVPMAGFPFFQLERYLKILVQDHGKHVAISEEIPLEASQRVKSGGTLFNREVRRIVTPGTLIDEQFLDPRKNNYLLAISLDSFDSPAPQAREAESKDDLLPESSLAGLAWLDLSSGDFLTQCTRIDALPSAIARIDPTELVLQPSEQSYLDKIVAPVIADSVVVSVHERDGSQLEVLSDTSHCADRHFLSAELSAIDLLQGYVRQQLPGLTLKYQSPIRQDPKDFMGIDRNSLRGLELTQTLRDGNYKGSLLHAIRRTSTESGTRLLTQRLCSPSTSLEIINERLDIVEAFTKHPEMIENISSFLRRTADSLRLIQKFSFARGDAHDLLALARTIDLTEAISSLIEEYLTKKYKCLEQINQRFSFSGPLELSRRIKSAIDEEGLTERRQSHEIEEAAAAAQAQVAIGVESQSADMAHLVKKLATKAFKRNEGVEEERKPSTEGWIMRRHASPDLERLHQSLEHLTTERDNLELSLRTQVSLPSLTLKFAPGMGYFVHLKGRDIAADTSVLGKTRTVGASKSTRSFYLSQWTDLGARLDDATNRIRVEETRIFNDLRDGVVRNLVVLRRNASVLDELDVGISFAKLAREYDLTRPHISSNLKHNIIKGRHMTVELGLITSGRSFTPNDCILDATPELASSHEPARVWLVTGPNMAGKSTFLRQTAILSILAQTGSFVPALHAELGLVDHVFSRVGSADNLAADQSTFMVEMLETAHILKHATSRSFVIMDEVGRGTTPEDGIAIGYAVLEHLLDINRCRALFATHFHKLADLFKERAGLTCYCTRVVEDSEDAFRFDHRLRPGVNSSSHAINVAKLAGVPDIVIETAKRLLITGAGQ